MPRGRLLAGTLLATGLAVVAMSAAPAGAVTSVELEHARAKLDQTSAQLARARTAAERLGFDERGELGRLERRLQSQKAALLRLESGLEARHAREEADDDTQEALTAAPEESGDGEPVVVLSDPPATSPLGATVVAAPGTARANERSPAVTGDSAVLAQQIDGYLASKASPLTPT